ncbi:heterokaryon incompatibility protein-domain-containing protein [Boletus edulis BED1]|uniref:Heterokaryon incompatibility protein-domain-containing protein n=1 Tax=Boletus edulis BED1 TaxID=1328754 RepID=A0AAD4BUZ1_BOLED|nr:heterokaryon incompatibility protein-domain-containing protein [Boletus edulis BED1]
MSPHITVLYFSAASTSTGLFEQTIALPTTTSPDSPPDSDPKFPLASLAALLVSLHPNTGLDKVLESSQWSVDAVMIPESEVASVFLRGGEEVALRRTVVRAISDPESFISKVPLPRSYNHIHTDDVAYKKLDPNEGDSLAQTITGLADAGLLQDEVVDFSLQDVIDQTKSDMPLRLICTEDGKLYDRNAIEARFRVEHAPFFEPTAVSSDPDTMIDAVQTSFAYVMFSHRWEMGEPLYKDVEGSDVFSLPESPGTRKLQHFCRHVRECGFRWAWSDTCCIDKNSTSELQKSIISMFMWYRNSALTIIYLGDVSDNSIEALKKSIWFLRGWTLQELIAPNRLLFFQSDWTLLITSDDLPIDNYKASSTFRNLITDITGIDDASLTHFDPASRTPTIRQRMSWAAHRKTTEIEDIAYCLMGIFDIHLPVMYGEGTSAFDRLQIEIMAKSDDPSLFDWTGKSSASNSLLAASPACFDPFTPPIVDPVPVTIRLAQALHKVPFVTDIQRGIDKLTVGLFNLQERVGVNAQHPANYLAGAKIHCHGFEYAVLDVEETKAMSDARKVASAQGKELTVFQYHILAESLHPVTVTLTEPIKTGFGYGRVQSKYLCVFRVWDQSLATGRSSEEDGNHPLRQPFVAHLLISKPGGIYRRVQVKKRIVAKLAQSLEFRMVVQLRTLMVE